MEAILLVGGMGTRLRPLTVNTPKPMLPVAGVPFVAHQLAQARAAGVTHVVLATSYRAEVFETWLGHGDRLGLDVDYVTEEEPLGTGGAIRNASVGLRAQADEPVLVFNGDVLSGHDIGAQLSLHAEHDADVTLYLTEVEDARAFGCVPLDDDGRVTAFLEKMPEPVTNRINAGCYVFRRSVIDRIPEGKVVSVERETFPGLLADGATVMGYVDTAYWLDLGTPEAFVRGSRDLVTGALASPALPGPTGDRLVLDGASVHETAAGMRRQRGRHRRGDRSGRRRRRIRDPGRGPDRRGRARGRLGGLRRRGHRAADQARRVRRWRRRAGRRGRRAGPRQPGLDRRRARRSGGAAVQRPLSGAHDHSCRNDVPPYRSIRYGGTSLRMAGSRSGGSRRLPARCPHPQQL